MRYDDSFPYSVFAMPNWRRRKRDYKKRVVWKTPRGKVNGSNKSLQTMERICRIHHPPWSIA